MTGKVVKVMAAGVTLLVAAGAVWTVWFDRPTSARSEPNSTPEKTATLERRNLVDTERFDGTLGYADEQTVAAQKPGTLTGVPGQGTLVERGKPLFEIDGKPVIAMYGSRPAWRDLAEGVPDGADVRQLEENLRAMGFDKGRRMKRDDHFDTYTTEAVKRWQKASGLDQDGAVNLGEAAFLPGPVRVGALKVETGDALQPGTEVYSATSNKRVVTLELQISRQSLIKVGDTVEIELPGGARVSGMIAGKGKEASGGQGGADGNGDSGGSDDDPKIKVTVTLPDDAPVSGLDEAPVDVSVTTQRKDGVIAAPVNALVALPGGGYGLEVQEGSSRRYIPVEVGLFAQGYVEVSGKDVKEGLKVVVPE